jgi:hypothetical protein
MVVFRIGAEFCWRLFEASAAVMLERCQLALHQRRIDLRHRVLKRALLDLESAHQKRVRSVRVVTLDGESRTLHDAEWPLFLAECLRELELDAPFESFRWSDIRQHWRQQSLRWHPDRGGSVQVWLRKQRAYQAIEELLPLCIDSSERVAMHQSQSQR